MSNWFFANEKGEQGPFTLQQIAQLVIDGDLQGTDTLRQEGSQEYEQVNDIVGLKRLVERMQQLGGGTIPRSPFFPLEEEDPDFSGNDTGVRTGSGLKVVNGGGSKAKMNSESTPKPKRKFEWTRERSYTALALLCFVIAGLQIYWYFNSFPPKFPEGSAVTLEMEVPGRLDQIKPKPPRFESVPDLPSQTPVLVPGLEELYWAKSPSLTRDLKTLAYVSFQEESKEDLFLTYRDSITDPFATPDAIASTKTEHNESQPALSPDGLELIYVSSHPQPHLMYCQRNALDVPFGTPEPLVIERDEFAEEIHDAPQFIDENRLLYAVTNNDLSERRPMIARRSSKTKPFSFSEKLPVSDGWPRYFVSSKGGRLFFPTKDGIALTAKHPGTQQYLTAEPFLNAGIVGDDPTRFDSTIWVTPKEDIVFYCSSGLNAENLDFNQMWMIQIN
ncbi:MAG: DUF4339 domain-containing protein [Planctomycetaceae bacterium]|nr:DUF4339 domain-containing protein [Planctomycetaceae bacterium]